MNKIKKLTNSKGFTLIELLAVITILGILVLLAAPKFSGYISEAKLTQIKADIKTHETVLSAKLAEDSNFLNELNTIERKNLEMYKENESLFAIEGKVERNYEFDGIYLDFPKEEFEIKTKLKGNFILDSEGKVYYEDYNIKNKIATDEEEDEVRPDGIVILKDKSGVIMPDGKFIHAVTEDDFELGFKANGYYSYVGNEREVYIPSDLKLNGKILTDASHLFNGSFVEKVVLLDNEITNMNSMFKDSQAISLDLSSFDTSNVTNMRYMFSDSHYETLNVNNFNTENVKNMYAMFQRVKSKSLDLISFNTSNVVNMSYMFYQSESKSINLSSFDTSNVEVMENMFRGSHFKSLNLKHFNTSNVNNMYAMFSNTQAAIIDISSFDTSNVTTMQSMFNKVQIKSIDVSSFNTKNVKIMSHMFRDSEIEILDLSSFDMTNVENVYMFGGSKATIGYARTQKDADILNSTSNKPKELTFTIKQQQ